MHREHSTVLLSFGTGHLRFAWLFVGSLGKGGRRGGTVPQKFGENRKGVEMLDGSISGGLGYEAMNGE